VDVPAKTVHTAAAAGTLDALSVKELKSFLYYRDAPLSGPKKDLIRRIDEVLEREEREEEAREQRREDRGEGAAAGEGGIPEGATGDADVHFDRSGEGAAAGEDRLIDEVSG
jgi:hypothetical protein